ncbi:hypothetical protein [Methanosphaerula palustris]|uniref:DUF8156 domain-containing protein n=1 Tax=Methanosphaerula palustris (strain ATCC BAA-1556 / DSM 19958 / E1-9c) TaxID=521011 RepID=B8GHC1_METPE|nr:hypothetical protein [Methanosphaerula palustris]ACL16526.1 conserved hypothetical protein [Methanosphaerula palustris E1-9c]
MGRVFLSPRMAVQRIARNWQQCGVLMREQDQIAADYLGKMAKQYASEGFYAFDDPLEAAVISALIGLVHTELDR